MPVIQEIRDVMDELIKRVILSETICTDTVHPDFNPLTSPLSIQPSKKRLREINEEYFSNKRSRTDSMDTTYDPDSDTEEKELDLVNFEDGYNQNGTVFYSELEDGKWMKSSTEKWRGSPFVDDCSPPSKLFENYEVYPLQSVDIHKEINDMGFTDLENDIVINEKHPLEGIVNERHFNLWEEEKPLFWRPFRTFIKSNDDMPSSMNEVINVFEDGRVMFTNKYVM